MNSSNAPSSLFNSFFIAGFECSSHLRRDGQRLDLLASTEHDARAIDDYLLMARHGMLTVRDGVRWHLVETHSRQYDLSSFLPMLSAAHSTGTQVIWDLLHYGWPSFLDIWDESFVDSFARFAAVIAQTVKDTSDEIPFYTAVNEISFFSWGGGAVQCLNPFATGRAMELKRILVRAAIAAIQAIGEIDHRARFVTAEPLIHVFPKSDTAEDIRQAERHNEGQFEATDMLCGKLEPELGGKREFLDIVGLNYYYNNQWVDEGSNIHLGHWVYRPVHELLANVFTRYGRPMFLAETGTEAGGRAPWLHYVCDEVAEAHAHRVPVEGICLYPILSHSGWDDGRHCHNGMFCGVTPNGARTIDRRMAAELARQRVLFLHPERR